MAAEKSSLERLNSFSDAVFAVIITILVLELHPPHSPSLEALISLWPTAISYAVSYLFIAIVWVNHYHLFQYAGVVTPRLVWVNFAHLFTVSLIPFSTAWIAATRMAELPVSIYAGVFVAVNATYLLLCNEAIDRPQTAEPALTPVRKVMRMRSLVTLGIFSFASLLALKSPASGMVLTCLCLVLYLRPDASHVSSIRHISRHRREKQGTVK